MFRFLKGHAANTIRTCFDNKVAHRWKNHKRFPVETKSFMGFCFRSTRGEGSLQRGRRVILSLLERMACPLLVGRVSRAAVISARSFLHLKFTVKIDDTGIHESPF